MRTVYPFRLLFIDRKSTRLNSSHVAISYAVFCLKKKILIESERHTSDIERAPFRWYALARASVYNIERLLDGIRQFGSRSMVLSLWLFFFNETPTTEIYTLSLHDALPIYAQTVIEELGSAVNDNAAWGTRSVDISA